MSFREKSAWIILVTLIILASAFFLHFPPPWTLTPPPSPEMFYLVLAMIGVFVAIVVIGHIVVAVLSPRDARTAKDERERLIELRSSAIAGRVYAFLSLTGIFVGLHITGANAIGIAYVVGSMFVVAEIVNYGLRVYFYRRGS